MSTTLTPVKNITSTDEFLMVCDEVAVHKVSLASAIAERDSKVQEILDIYDHTIKATMDTIKRRQKLAETWAKKNRKQILTGNSKRGLSPLSVYGFRTGQPTIKPKGKLRIADIVKDLIDTGKQSLVRTKQDLDKEAAGRLTDEQLDEIGLRRVQLERFIVEPRNNEKEELA